MNLFILTSTKNGKIERDFYPTWDEAKKAADIFKKAGYTVDINKIL